MSSFKRLVDIAKAEVGSVLDKAEKGAQRVSERVTERVTGGRKLEEFSDEQLTAEIEKRRAQKQLKDEEDARKAADQARRAKADPGAAAGPSAPSGHAAEPAGPRPAAEPAPSSRAQAGKIVGNQLERYYANLEVEPGADLETIKRAYRRLMRKYHPDKHAGDPSKYKAATELAQSLTRAYMELKKHLES